MKLIFSRRIESLRPNIEEQLWGVACRCKEADPAIKIMGLHISIRSSSRPLHWAGQAIPEEETYMLRPKQLIVHPAGRITMTLGDKVSYTNTIRLFAHELRHIGQYHRGRKEYGYLTTEWMPESQVEKDAYAFEDEILDRMSSTRRCNDRP